MIKRMFYILILTTGLFMCGSSELMTGDCVIVFNLENQNKTILPGISMDIVSYVISGSGPQSALLRGKTISVQSQTKLTGLSSGSWTIAVVGLNRDGIAVGSGSNTVSISAGSESALTITIVPLTGNGALSVTASWTLSQIASPVVNATLTSLTGQAADISVTMNSGSALCSNGSLAAGYYILKIQLLDGTTSRSRFIDIVRIVSGQTTSSVIPLAVITAPSQIIADHTVVDRYNAIPDKYINIVKTYLVDIAGESHSSGYRIGMNLLERMNSKYQVETFDGSSDAIPAVSTANLRLGRHAAVGEEEFFTNAAAITAIKAFIAAQETAANPVHVMGFGWCWDMERGTATSSRNTTYNVPWYGSSVRGPEGDLSWGLTSADYSITGNSVCMDTYLSAVEEYKTYCETNNYSCKVIYTTGPVDNYSGAAGYQGEVKHDYIRNYVAADPSRILFDYADILCYNNSGEKNIINWSDNGTNRPFAHIHSDNMMDYDVNWNTIAHTEDGDHIGEVGTVRLAKAMWWMLARIAGWDGVSTE